MSAAAKLLPPLNTKASRFPPVISPSHITLVELVFTILETASKNEEEDEEDVEDALDLMDDDTGRGISPVAQHSDSDVDSVFKGSGAQNLDDDDDDDEEDDDDEGNGADKEDDDSIQPKKTKGRGVRFLIMITPHDDAYLCSILLSRKKCNLQGLVVNFSPGR